MKTRYKQYLEKMLEDNKKIFDEFKNLHDNYQKSPDELQDKFNVEGEKILEIVRLYESRLCSNQERGKYIRYSTNLAEKFQQEIKKVFPLIDHVGLKVEKFEIKKISL